MISKISIIIPVYNTKEEYLQNCFESINNQTYKDFEVIIVDDGSKEETASFLDTYKKFENYKIFHKKNEGLSTARNFGIEKAEGDWLMFVDSDDYLEKNALELLFKQTNNMDIVIGGVKRTTINNVITYENCILEREEKKKLIQSIFQAKSGKFLYVDGLWGKLYKKDFIEKNKIKLEKDLKYGEDAVFNIEAYTKATKIYLFSETVYYWRTNEESVTARYNPKLMDEQEKTLNRIQSKFPKIVEEQQNEFMSYISRTIKNIIENIYFSKEITQKEKKELMKRMLNKPIYNECINSNKHNETPFKRKVILGLLKVKQFLILKMLFKSYRFISKRVRA